MSGGKQRLSVDDVGRCQANGEILVLQVVLIFNVVVTGDKATRGGRHKCCLWGMPFLPIIC